MMFHTIVEVSMPHGKCVNSFSSVELLLLLLECAQDCLSVFAGYLKSQEVPMVVVSHDREFLDQLCNKIVETDQVRNNMLRH